MQKRILPLIAVLLLLTACSKNSTESDTSPLLGNWTFTTMKVDGVEVNPDNYAEVFTKFLFSISGNGTVWIENKGKPNGSASMTWSENGSNFTIHISGRTSAATFAFSISGTKLTITDSSGYQYIYTKES